MKDKLAKLASLLEEARQVAMELVAEARKASEWRIAATSAFVVGRLDEIDKMARIKEHESWPS